VFSIVGEGPFSESTARAIATARPAVSAAALRWPESCSNAAQLLKCTAAIFVSLRPWLSRRAMTRRYTASASAYR